MNVMAMNILERARPDLDSICRKFGVRKLSVFGSALSDRWKAKSSDFDFVVEYGPPPEGIDLFAQQFVMQVELEKLLGRSVDLIELLKEIDAYYPPEVTIRIILDNHSAHMSSANSGNWFSQFLPKDLTGSSEFDPFSYHFTV